MAKISGPLTRVSTPIILTPVGDTASKNRIIIGPNGPKTPIDLPDGYYNVDVVNQVTFVDPINLAGDVNVNTIFSRGGSGGGGGSAPVAGVVVLRSAEPVPEGTPAGTVVVRV